MTATAFALRLLDLLVAGALTYERVVQMRAQLAAMQADGRAPNAGAWAELLTTIEADTDRLQAAANRLG